LQIENREKTTKLSLI